MTSSLKCFSHRTAVNVAVKLGLFTNRVHLLSSGFFTEKWKVVTFPSLADNSVIYLVEHPWETHLLGIFLGVEHVVLLKTESENNSHRYNLREVLPTLSVAGLYGKVRVWIPFHQNLACLLACFPYYINQT